MSKFSKKVQTGNVGEKALLDLLSIAGLRCNQNKSKNKSELLKYDIEAWFPNGDRLTFEVKYDQAEARTGNLAIEYYNVKQAKPSGVAATNADLWVFALDSPFRLYATSVSRLKNWFNTKPCFKDVPCGGDDNAAIKLWRSDELLTIFTRLDDLDPWVIASTIKKLTENTLAHAA